jgi:heme/copper-type cytochrome/quinol oxidase subunit 2
MRAAAVLRSVRFSRAALAGVTAAAMVLAGCDSGSKTATDAPLSIDVTIAHGQVTPANATLQAKVAQPITFHVTSDAVDELHVHSVPDHKFEIAAAPNQTFQFSVDVPGNVDVELHHLDRTIATIQVRP